MLNFLKITIIYSLVIFQFFILYFFIIPCKAIDIKDFEEEFIVYPGGILQFDYRSISNSARADSRFDIRRARLNIEGKISSRLNYKLECELQGNETRKLTDAFGNYYFFPRHRVQFGQFKVPFSYEWSINDKDFPFAERSIGFSMQPNRDIGLMFAGDVFNNFFSYYLGSFNGDGVDGSSRGNQKDDPELALRCIIKPFSFTKIPLLNNFFSGISITEGRIDLNNILLNVKSTGMIGTKRNLYTLNANTKFGALLDVNKKKRMCFESGAIFGPVTLFFEYKRLKYIDLKPVRGDLSNANFYSWYAAILINIIDEYYNQNNTRQTNINGKQLNSYSLCQIALRREHFSGDSNWIISNSFNSTKEAEAYSIALNWAWYPVYRFLIDYTYTDISNPLRIRINPDGSIEYMKSETSFTCRFQINF